MKLLAVLALSMPAAAIAQTAAQAPPAPARSSEERICRTSGELGSRLNRTRICRTRAQWEEARRENRDTVDRAQRQFEPTVDGVLPPGN